MLTAETLQGFFDMLETEPILPNPPMLMMSPTMHRRVYIAHGLAHFTVEPERKLRKVHLRTIAKRRQERRRRLERAYEERYNSPYQEDQTLSFEAYLPNIGWASIFRSPTQLPSSQSLTNDKE